MLVKFKIEEVVEITRARIVYIEVTEEEEAIISRSLSKNKLNLDNKVDEHPLHILTELVRQQHSKKGDITEQVIKAIRL